MKVYFNNVNFSSSSGPNTFGSRLANELAKNPEVKIVDAKDDYDIFLCFIEPTHSPRPSSKLIQRLDGIWFKEGQFESHNKLIKWAYDRADSIVWQSQFDKEMTVKWWGERSGKVIHNGIEIKPAEPSTEILEFSKKFDRVFVCSSNWHRQKRLKENIELFKLVSGENDGLLVMGNSPDHVLNEERIYYSGQIPHQSCLEVYAAADWMIHLAWLDHCPNVVVEALSQNCPVICTDSGGTKELVRDNGVIVPESIKYEYQLCDYDNPPSLDLSKISLNKIEVQNDYLDISKVAIQYLDLFNKI